MTKIRAWGSAVAIGFVALGIAHPARAAVPAGYQMTFDDEFNGTSLDTTKWNYRNLGARQSGVNTTDAVTLDGQGHLNITTTAVANGTGGYTYNTGMIGTQGLFSQAYGYWEASIDMTNLPGKFSDFWLQSPTMGQTIGNTTTSGTEIDVEEYSPVFGSTANTVQSTLHWDGYGTSTKQASLSSTIAGLSTGFHTYGVLWTPTSYTFYVDGNATWTTTQAISGVAEYAILSTEVGPWGGPISPSIAPDTMSVDYVRVYSDPLLALTAVPEPACATVILGFAMFSGRRRARKLV